MNQFEHTAFNYEKLHKFKIPALKSNVIKAQRYQNQLLKENLNAPSYVPNWLIHKEASINKVNDEYELTQICAKAATKII